MSQQGLQRLDQLLNVLKSQLPSIAQASDTPGVDLPRFVYGTLQRAGLGAEVGPFVMATVGLIGPSEAHTPTGVTDGTMPNDHSANIVMDGA